MFHPGPFQPDELSRRDFMRAAGLAGLASFAGVQPPSLRADETVSLPFDNGERPLVKYPQKRPLIRLTTRPPQLETPFSVFNEGALTPDDVFSGGDEIKFRSRGIAVTKMCRRAGGASSIRTHASAGFVESAAGLE